MAEPIEALTFRDAAAWEKWLAKHHTKEPGVWIRMGRAGSGIASVTYAEALDVALCYGWIDAIKRSESKETWLQRFTPRSKRSIWSKVNRAKAIALIKVGRMLPAGLAQVQQAKQDGRWEAAYDSPGKATVPSDLARALAANPRAKVFFETLKGFNRYAILHRIQVVKRPETRTRKITQFVAMLERREVFFPDGPPYSKRKT
jgi:uncharacterized protein YdeI (YjbR/CyaY-like superfamily)